MILISYRHRTTGGSGGPVTTVTTLDDLTSAVTGNSSKIVVIEGRWVQQTPEMSSSAIVL